MSRKVLSRMDSAVQGNDFELIPMVWMESQHSIGEPTCHDFPRFVITSEKSRLEVRNRWRWSRFFGKKDPLRAKFQKKMFPKGFTASQNHVLCADFVKIGWPEIGSRALFTWQKKTKLLQGLLLSLLCGSVRAQTLARPAPNNILGVPQISSKFVHFRRSYSRKREHRWNATQSIFNTRRKLQLLRRAKTDNTTGTVRTVVRGRPLPNMLINSTTCRSMVDIQSAAAEIRRGKKERRKKPQGKNIMACPIPYGGLKNMQVSIQCYRWWLLMSWVKLLATHTYFMTTFQVNSD